MPGRPRGRRRRLAHAGIARAFLAAVGAIDAERSAGAGIEAILQESRRFCARRGRRRAGFGRLRSRRGARRQSARHSRRLRRKIGLVSPHPLKPRRQAGDRLHAQCAGRRRSRPRRHRLHQRPRHLDARERQDGVSRRFDRVRRTHSQHPDVIEQIDDRPHADRGRRGRGRLHCTDARASAHTADHQLPYAGSGDPARCGAEYGARCAHDAGHFQLIRLRRTKHLAGADAGAGVTGATTATLADRVNAGPSPTMRALTLVADRKIELLEVAAPPAPATGEVQIRIKAIGLNHIDVWGWRGMAFAKRTLPLIVGVEAAGEIAAVGSDVTAFKPGDRVVAYGALTCGKCKACREGRDNLCENVGSIMGFHVDGFARDLVNMPARLVVPVPDNVSFRDAACAPVAFGTVQHMLFDNAKLESGETILVQAGGSGIGTSAIKMAKAIGATVITTVGDDAKAEKAKALGADHVINYKTDRFETIVRKLTGKKGVDVAFEHVGPDTFNGSLLCLKRGGRLVTCGSTSGQSITMNLFQLYLQQYRIFGSFGCSIRNIHESLAKMASGMLPVIDTEVPLAEFERGLARLESRQVFGKIIVLF